MKRISALFLSLFILSNTLFALSFEEYLKPESWIPNDITLIAGNDKWTVGGLSYNWDDQLSFSEQIYLRAPAWSLSIDWMGITNRGWQNGWDIHDYSKIGDGNRIQGRYDELQLYFGMPLEIVDVDPLWVWFNPEIGFSIAGNQNHVFIQNLSHELLKLVSSVNIPYEIEGNIINPIFRGEFEFGYIFKELDHSYLFSALRFSHKETLNFSRQNSISSVIGITTEYDDLLTVSLGYAWNNAQSGWKTQELYYDCIDGWTLNMTLDTGVFLIEYQTALEHGIGYGKLALNVLSFTGESFWKETDVSYSIGMVFQLNNTFFANDIAIPIKGTQWDIYLSDRYFSGDPAFKNWEIGLNHDLYPRYKRSYSGLYLGGKYHFELLDKDALIQPYAKAGIGLMKWEVRTVRNMQLTNYEYDEATGNMIAVPNLIHSTISPVLPSIGADIEFGITCLPEGELKSSNTIFQLNIFAGVTAIHNSKHVQAYLESYTEDSLRIGTFIPRWGFSLEMGFDI